MKKLTNILLQFANFFRRIYWRIFKPVTFGVRVILVKDNDLVLVKHRYDKFWYFPGGGVKKDETEKDAAKREALEEVNISIISFAKTLGRYRNIQEGKKDNIVVLVADKWEKVKGRQSIEIEHIDLFNLQNLPNNTSPATKRRINEFLSGQTKVYSGTW